MRISLQPAFILHRRPYRETSVLLDIFTLEYGRISGILKGVRTQRSKLRPLVQPFVPLLVSWQAKSDLATLTNIEPNGSMGRLLADRLISGLYLNELLTRILHKHDPYPELYTIYHKTLLELQGPFLQLKCLRIFEKRLLESIGYGLQLQGEANSKKPFYHNNHYYFHPEHGFELCETELDNLACFSGKSLIALANEQWEDEKTLQDAKRLMRLALMPLLGQYQLNSRELFVNFKK